MSGGRPSKYKPEYCEEVIDLGKQGLSVVEIACKIGVGRNTLETEWTAKHPEFQQAFARAREESQSWWEQQGREGLTKQGFNAQVWSRSMSARFPKDWRETKATEVTGKDGGPIEYSDVTEDIEAVEKLIGGLAERSQIRTTLQ